MGSRNKWFSAAAIAAVLLLCAGGAYAYWSAHAYPGLSSIEVADETIYVYVADTEAKRELGLSGRAGLKEDEGMLFIFPVEGKPAFWMKDMKFAIDILWIANDGSIIHIEENVTPDTYPKSFAPRTGLAKYVLELPAGFSKVHELQVGDVVEL